MKRSIFCIIAILTFFAQSALFGQTNYNGIDVSIKFYDKTIYYTDDIDDNPIFVKVSISNNTTSTFRFKLSDDRMFSIDVNGKTVKGLSLPANRELTEKRSTSRTVYFREIALESGEEYSFVENIRDYLSIDSSGVYYISVKLYPELYKSKSLAISSNQLSLDIRPYAGVTSSVLPVAVSTAEILIPEAISPDKVIEQTIIARQRNLWDHFFLYMDLEQMLMNDDVRERKYRTASADERKRMLSSYRSDLMQNRIDNEIVSLPESFIIDKTEYTQTEGSVTVREWFNEDTFKQVKQYVYYLRQRDGIWQIYRYEVTNIGTE